ncbi:MAG: hypothetical protein NTW85_16710 [Methylococcales bacterium]|nr:hypothetical protein [Methylococcales bacterium]
MELAECGTFRGDAIAAKIDGWNCDFVAHALQLWAMIFSSVVTGKPSSS